MEGPSNSLKLWGLALLIFAGIALCLLALIPDSPRGGATPSARLVMWGAGCFCVAAIWIWWDRRCRQLTPDEKTEQLLFEVAKRYRRVKSLDAVLDEYRCQGASEGTLELVKCAPRLLKARGDVKLQVGIQIFLLGFILTAGTYVLGRLVGFSQYIIAFGAIGGGVGLILDGIRQRRSFGR